MPPPVGPADAKAMWEEWSGLSRLTPSQHEGKLT